MKNNKYVGKYKQVNISRTIHLFLNLETRENIRFYMKQQHVKMHLLIVYLVSWTSQVAQW